MSEKRRIPSLRFKRFDGEWEEKNLKKISKLKKGKNLLKSSLCAYGDKECILYGEIFTTYNSVIENIVSRTNDYGYTTKGNSLLFPGSSTTRNQFFECTSLKKSGVELGTDISIFEIDEHNDSNFLSFLFSINYYKQKLQDLTQGTTINHLYQKDIAVCPIFIPSLDEQQKIADFFSKLDNLISLYERKLEIFKASKKYYLSNMFPKEGKTIPELRFKGFDGEWEEKELGEISKVFGTGVDKLINDNEIVGKIVNFVDVFKNTILDEDFIFNKVSYTKEEYEKYRVFKGDILITPSSEDKLDIGLTSMINFDNTENLVYSYHLNLVRLNNNVFPMFMSYLFRTKRIKKYFFEVSQGITRYTLSREHIKKALIKFPQLLEQQKIADFFSKFDETIKGIEQKIENLKQTKKYYLQNMFV